MAADDRLKAKRFDGLLADVRYGLVHGVGDKNQIEVFRADGAHARHLLDEADHLAPVVGSEEEDGKVLNLAGLDKRQRLKQLIHSARAPGENDKRIGVFHEQRFANKKVVQRHAAVEVGIALLLEWQFDVTADGTAARVLSPPIGRFHNAWPTAGHHREAKPRNLRTRLPGQLVVWVVFPRPR